MKYVGKKKNQHLKVKYEISEKERIEMRASTIKWRHWCYAGMILAFLTLISVLGFGMLVVENSAKISANELILPGLTNFGIFMGLGFLACGTEIFYGWYWLKTLIIKWKLDRENK